MTNITRARERARARQARHDATRSRRRMRLAVGAGVVFGVGLMIGVAAGLFLSGPETTSQPIAETTDPQTPEPVQHAAGAKPESDTTQTESRMATARRERTGEPDAASSSPSSPPSKRVEDPRAPKKAPPPAKAAKRPASSPSREAPETSPEAPAREAEPVAPPWRRYAVKAPPAAEGTPRIAIVIDDLGLNRPNAWEAVHLPAPLTLAFMTYAPGLPKITRAAREAGHELLVHVPMAPHDSKTDPGPKVLDPALDAKELLSRLDWDLSRFEGYVGINNHMGSAFTRDSKGMHTVLAELRRRGLMFLDSRTIGSSVGDEVAQELGVPHTSRDVFLDNDPTPEAIRARLAEVVEIARDRGHAIAIGHPYDETIQVLADWLPTLRDRGLVLVPVSALAKTGDHRPDLAELSRHEQGAQPERR